jgi:hypothetical protein
VPEDLALSAAVNIPAEYLVDPARAVRLFPLLPWMAHATPEQLYLPREAIKARYAPWTPEHTISLLRAHRDQLGAGTPRPQPEGPARKGPCPCGSGEKYKRCCGADAPD